MPNLFLSVRGFLMVEIGDISLFPAPFMPIYLRFSVDAQSSRPAVTASPAEMRTCSLALLAKSATARRRHLPYIEARRAEKRYFLRYLVRFADDADAAFSSAHARALPQPAYTSLPRSTIH